MRDKEVGHVATLYVVAILMVVGALVYAGRIHLTYMAPTMVVPPLLILGSSLLFAGLFWIRVWFASAAGVRQGWRRFFSPAYRTIRDTLRQRPYAGIALAAACLYAVLLMLAEGAIKREPMGFRVGVLWEGVPGFVPQIYVFPWPDLGLRLDAYQIAAMLFLGTLFGVNVALLVHLYAMQGRLLFRGKGLASGLGGAAAGLLVTCPSCATTPIAALVSTFLLPAGAIFQTVIGTTSVYLISVLLAFLGVSLSSQAVEQGLSCRLPVGDEST